MKITFIGPAGLTFTSLAYEKLAILFSGPHSADDSVTLELATKNEDVLQMLCASKRYGALAMETKAEGRVDPPVNSFIELLRTYSGSECPVQVLGALRMDIHFALMVKEGVLISDIKTITAHPKSFGPCRCNIKKLGVEIREATSNGKAIEDVAASDVSDGLAALGPIEAGKKCGLTVLNDAFEDAPAVTTFYFLGPRENEGVQNLTTETRAHVSTEALVDGYKTYRCLSVFRVKHIPGSLVQVMLPFANAGINMRLIHSLYLENETYDFAIETESSAEELFVHNQALAEAQKFMDTHIQFGPFPVV